MRLVVWNCRMALHRKWEALARLRPDVAVVPECADPALPPLDALAIPAARRAWVGPKPRKGLGVFAFGGTTLEPHRRTRRELPDELPDGLLLGVRGPREFQLLAVWARAPGYVERLHEVLDQHRDRLGAGDSVVAGDFNANAIWDRAHGEKSHTQLVRRLEELGLVSAYHATRDEAQGAETVPTFHLHSRNRSRFHIDFAFVPRRWLSEGRLRCVVGAPGRWLELSDHRPLTIEVGPR